MARQYISDGGAINETGSYQYVSDNGVLNETSGTLSPSAVISWTESADTFSATGNVSGGAVSSTISWTEEADTFSVSVTVIASSISGTVSWTEAGDTFAISATASASGTLTTGVFKNNTGSVLSNLSGLTVTVLNLSTMAFVKTFTGQTTSGTGVMSINDPLFTSGTWYAVVTKNASDVLGVEKYQAS